MSEEKPPDQPTTKEIPKVDPTLEMLKKIDTKVDGLRVDVSLLGENYRDLTQRVTLGEKWRQDHDEWRARTSERAKAEEQTRSKVDMEHQAQLVHIEDRFKAMTEAQTGTIVTAMERAAKTPQGQKVVNALVAFIVVVLGVAGAWLSMHGGAK